MFSGGKAINRTQFLYSEANSSERWIRPSALLFWTYNFVPNFKPILHVCDRESVKCRHYRARQKSAFTHSELDIEQACTHFVGSLCGPSSLRTLIHPQSSVAGINTYNFRFFYITSSNLGVITTEHNLRCIIFTYENQLVK